MSTEQRFDFEETANGRVRIRCNGRVVTTLKGVQAIKFIGRAESLDEPGLQLLMAKATGNFRRGNEKVSKQKYRNSTQGD